MASKPKKEIVTAKRQRGWQTTMAPERYPVCSSISRCRGSALLSFLTYRAQFGESLRIAFVPSSEAHIFPFTMQRDKASKAYLRDVAAWYKFRFSNNSARPISIVTIKYRENNPDTVWSDIPAPLVADLRTSESELKATKIIDPPFRVDIGATEELFAFVPLTVSRQLGEYLFELLRDPNHQPTSKIERALLDPDYFKNFEQRVTEGLRTGSLGKFVEFEQADISRVMFERPPFIRDSSGDWIFRDANNDSNDGFRFRDRLSTLNQVNDAILSSKADTLRIEDSPSRGLELVFYLGSGSVEYLRLSRSENALDRLQFSGR
jgi:hypothetical protein